MKKFFISIVLLLAFISSAAAGEAIKPVSTSPITTFHEIWGIPWGVEYEEFAELAKQHSNILFELDYEKDSFASYVAIPEQNVTMFTYPVVISADFSGEPKQLTEMNFVFLDAKTSIDVDYAYAMLASLVKDLAKQYGPPRYACFHESFSTHRNISFALPLHGSVLDLEKLKELRKNFMLFPSVQIFFDNVYLYGGTIKSDGSGVSIQMGAFSRKIKDRPYRIPETDILPYEQYDSIINTTVLESLTPTQTPISQLNVGL